MHEFVHTVKQLSDRHLSVSGVREEIDNDRSYSCSDSRKAQAKRWRLRQVYEKAK